VETVERARDLAVAAGVHTPTSGTVAFPSPWNTWCHSCKMKLIERVGYALDSNLIRRKFQVRDAHPRNLVTRTALAFPAENRHSLFVFAVLCG